MNSEFSDLDSSESTLTLSIIEEISFSSSFSSRIKRLEKEIIYFKYYLG